MTHAIILSVTHQPHRKSILISTMLSLHWHYQTFFYSYLWCYIPPFLLFLFQFQQTNYGSCKQTATPPQKTNYFRDLNRQMLKSLWLDPYIMFLACYMWQQFFKLMECVAFQFFLTHELTTEWSTLALSLHDLDQEVDMLKYIKTWKMETWKTI